MTWADSAEAHRTAESRARSAACAREHRAAWRVLQRLCNYSAFNGYRCTPSDYSALGCLTCGRVWRTKAAYVASVPDIGPDEARS